MRFFLHTSDKLPRIRKNIIVLTLDSWDDWFTYSTLYIVMYYNEVGVAITLGSVKIGQTGMKSGQRNPDLPKEFHTLDDDFFSIGQDVSYYETLNSYGAEFRDSVLIALRDIANDPLIYEKAIKEHVTKISLLRSVSQASVIGQYRRLAQGHATLTPYNFHYYAPSHSKSQVGRMVLDFNIVPNSNPPTNIHVIIGRNGVGKTYLFDNMITTLLDGNASSSKNGYFESDEKGSGYLFANLVSVSFSAFDETDPIKEQRDKTKFLNYSYIGLKRISKDNGKLSPPKSPIILKNEFVKSIEQCRLTGKSSRWLRALEILEADPIFEEAEISQIAKIDVGQEFEMTASLIFNKLSSGHKTVLLTITRLVETIEERSLVLLDEPEGYLHPPLLSAFVRALSDLLINRNAVAIIGTHSPVVLQEVPRSCVWRLRRVGANSIAERLDIESFGENVGLLTQEVFGLEVTHSGFHKILHELSEEKESYEEAIAALDEQLGLEGRAILRNLMNMKL